MAEEEGPYDASDPRQVRARIKEAQRWEDRRTKVIITLMAAEDGRRFVREIFETCKLGVNPFNPELAKMSFHCGELNIGLQLYSVIVNAAPDLYTLMMSEARVGDPVDAEIRENQKD